MKLCLAFMVDMMWEIRRWLANYPRFHLHFTPIYGSWLNLVKRWFATLTTKQLRRGTHRSVAALKRGISSVHRDHQRASDTVRVDQECRRFWLASSGSPSGPWPHTLRENFS